MENEKQLKSKYNLITVAFSMGTLLIGCGLGAFMNNLKYQKYNNEHIEKIVETYYMLKDEWWFASQYDDIDAYLTDLAIKGMTDLNADNFTFYTSSMEDQGLAVSSKGIGISHTYYGGYRLITSVFKDSPADEVGLKKGDIILGLYESATEGSEIIDFQTLGAQEVIDVMSNYKDDNIKFKIDSNGVIKDVNIARDEYIQYAVDWDYDVINGDVILDMKISNFLDRSLVLDVIEAIDEVIEKENKIDKLVIDLRDNGGGYVDLATSLSSLFIPRGSTILQVEYANGKTTTYKNTSNPYENIGKINLIQNKNSASATELFILALKENLPEEKVDVIGSNSYGKGIMQSFIEFNDGSVIRYTSARTLSPNGNSIHGIGIEPTIRLDYDETLINYYGEIGFATQEYKELIRKQINFVLDSDYENYNEALSAFIEKEELDKIIFDYQVGRLLQMRAYDLYLEYEIQVYKNALEV